MAIVWPSPDVHIACWCSAIFSIISFLATPIAILAYFNSATIRQTYQNLLLLALLVNAQVYTISAINGFMEFFLLLLTNLWTLLLRLPFYDRTQLVPSLFATLHCTACISITCFCYIQIYRFCIKWKKSTPENVLSNMNPVAQKESDKEFKILWTTVLLVVWTFIGNWHYLLLHRMDSFAIIACL